MNQPTEDRLKRIEEEQENLREEVRKLREQITEPIRIDHLEIDRGGTQELLKETNKKLDKIIQTQADRSESFDTLERSQQELKQELHTLSNNWLDSLQENVDEVKQEISGTRADILALKESQADFRDTLIAVKEDITAIKNEHGAKLDLILQLLQQKS
ncbi:MAG TPA: hypothetical protein VHV10_04550 [Ktedonobacteraceae bacterium]|nr:hypothetical protein [Ktedonobacteraceae bacterium]